MMLLRVINRIIPQKYYVVYTHLISPLYYLNDIQLSIEDVHQPCTQPNVILQLTYYKKYATI